MKTDGKSFQGNDYKNKNNKFRLGFENVKSKKLKKIKGIDHGFFNKIGGKSKGIFKSLNCGPGSRDKISNVKKS